VTLQMLTLRYAIFAFIAIVTNLATQRAILQLGYTNTFFVIAVGVGTIIGLIIKYLLDKHWIFYDYENGLKNHGQKFLLYTVMGGVTTAIFWGTETAFWLIWKTDLMREIGAVIGLVIGYVVKYNLDTRFTFTDPQLRAMP
jgi:putative flippase GtrA